MICSLIDPYITTKKELLPHPSEEGGRSNTVVYSGSKFQLSSHFHNNHFTVTRQRCCCQEEGYSLQKYPCKIQHLLHLERSAVILAKKV
jgi:hypothetical protein